MYKDLIGRDITLGDVVAIHSGGDYGSFEVGVVTAFKPKTVQVDGYRTVAASYCAVITESYRVTKPQIYAGLMTKWKEVIDKNSGVPIKVTQTFSIVCFRGITTGANGHRLPNGKSEVRLTVMDNGIPKANTFKGDGQTGYLIEGARDWFKIKSWTGRPLSKRSVGKLLGHIPTECAVLYTGSDSDCKAFITDIAQKATK